MFAKAITPVLNKEKYNRVHDALTLLENDLRYHKALVKQAGKMLNVNMREMQKMMNSLHMT